MIRTMVRLDRERGMEQHREGDQAWDRARLEWDRAWDLAWGRAWDLARDRARHRAWDRAWSKIDDIVSK